MTVVIDGTLGISPVTPSGTSSSIDGMTVGRGGGEISTNTAVGTSALTANTTGSSSVAVGYQAGYSNVAATDNTFIGYQAGYSSNRSSGAPANVCVGSLAGYGLTTGYRNTFIGPQTSGVGSGYYVTTGYNNTIIGGYNGNQGGLDIRTSNNYIVLSDGDGNPRAYWDNSGIPTFTGSGLTIGSGTYKIASQGSGIAYMGFITASSALQLSFNSLTAGVSLGSGATSWGSFSDSRLKDITGTYTNALSDIAQIQPVKFTWKNDSSKKPCVGVIAQSVQNVVPESVESMAYVENDTTEYLQVRYTELIPLMIASIQQLKAEFDAYKEAHP